MNNMMKLMILASMRASCGFEEIYRSRIPKMMTEEQKKRIHDTYNRQFHKYNINGVEIVAKSKKDAKKIYSKMKG